MGERAQGDEGGHTSAAWVNFPVARGHALVIPRRPDAFTVGINDGASVGQTVEHAQASGNGVTRSL